MPPKERFDTGRAAPYNSPSSPCPARRFTRSRAARHGSRPCPPRHRRFCEGGGRPSPRSADQYEGASTWAVGWFPANNLGYVASEHDYIGARPFAREESESAKGPFKPQGRAPSGKSLGRIREDRHRRTSVKADKKQKKGRLDADPTNQLKHYGTAHGEHATPHATERTRHRTAMMDHSATALCEANATLYCNGARTPPYCDGS